VVEDKKAKPAFDYHMVEFGVFLQNKEI